MPNTTIHTTVDVWEALGRAIGLRCAENVHHIIAVVDGWLMDPAEKAEILTTCNRVVDFLEAEGY